jgi:hypothetical protein
MRIANARHAIFFLMLLLLCSCNLFIPPFTFNNPHDPQNPWEYKGIVGKTYMSDNSGLPLISDIAVTTDGSMLVAASNNQKGIWEIATGSGASSYFSAGSDQRGDIKFQSLCIDDSGSTIYLVRADGRSIYKVDRATHAFAQIYALPDSASENYFDIAIDSSGNLYIADNTQGKCLIQRMSTSGSILGTIDSPYLTNVNSIAVSDSYLYVSCQNYSCVLILDKASGATYGEIYWDGSAWHNVVSGGAPTVGNSSTQQIAYNRAQSRLYASFWDGSPVGIFDPSNLSTPHQASFGNTSDYSTTWDIGIAVDNSGKMYASDPRLTFIKELSSGTTVYSNRAREPEEFLNVTDMHLGASGTMYFVDNSLWQITSLTSDGQFHLFGTPGNGAGQLWWPQAITEKNGETYCGCGGGGWRVLHYASSGGFLDENSVSGEGNPMRMATMADGRILIWADRGGPGKAFYTYTTSPWTLAGGPYVPDARFATAYDVHLCLFADGKVYCTLWKDTYASVGYLSDDLATYTEIWNSSSESVFTTPHLGSNCFRTTGIERAPAGDIWVGFSGLSAVVRFTPAGGVFASLSTYTDYTGNKWRAGKIVAYSIDANSYWQGPSSRLMCVDAEQNIFVSYDQTDLNILEFSPTVSLP